MKGNGKTFPQVMEGEKKVGKKRGGEEKVGGELKKVGLCYREGPDGGRNYWGDQMAGGVEQGADALWGDLGTNQQGALGRFVKEGGGFWGVGTLLGCSALPF